MNANVLIIKQNTSEFVFINYLSKSSWLYCWSIVRQEFYEFRLLLHGKTASGNQRELSWAGRLSQQYLTPKRVLFYSNSNSIYCVHKKIICLTRICLPNNARDWPIVRPRESRLFSRWQLTTIRVEVLVEITPIGRDQTGTERAYCSNESTRVLVQNCSAALVGGANTT